MPAVPAALPAKLTHQEAPEVARALAKALRDEGGARSAAAGAVEPWPVDASALTHFDSSALAVLLECRRLASAQGRKVKISNAPPKLEQLARLYGLEELLEVSTRPEDQG